MASNWKPVHALDGGTNLNPGWWTMRDRGRVVGHVERIEHDGHWWFRGWSPDMLWILGYEPTLAQAATKMWAWDTDQRMQPGTRGR